MNSDVALLGSINTIMVMVSVLGAFLQLRTVRKKRMTSQANGRATARLSLNQMMVSFFAYLAFFIFGISLSPINHFLVWPRLAGTIIVASIIYEMWFDRRSLRSLLCLLSIVITLSASWFGLLFKADVQALMQNISTGMTLIISLLIAQGYAHQSLLIYESGSTGALDIRMPLFILLMDISTLAFALSLGAVNTWPIVVLATTSAMTKIVILIQFRWVRVSSSARRKREARIAAGA